MGTDDARLPINRLWVASVRSPDSTATAPPRGELPSARLPLKLLDRIVSRPPRTATAPPRASPDFDGEYSYLPDGSGLGSYIQKFDDGSTLNVEHVINTDGSYTESWVFHDATTAVDPDQEGHVNYPSAAQAD